MAKPLPTQSIGQLVQLIGLHAQGASVEQLERALGVAASRRSLQRWLAALQSDGRIAHW